MDFALSCPKLCPKHSFMKIGCFPPLHTVSQIIQLACTVMYTVLEIARRDEIVNAFLSSLPGIHRRANMRHKLGVQRRRHEWILFAVSSMTTCTVHQHRGLEKYDASNSPYSSHVKIPPDRLPTRYFGSR